MCSFKSIYTLLWVCCIAFVGGEELCGQQYGVLLGQRTLYATSCFDLGQTPHQTPQVISRMQKSYMPINHQWYSTTDALMGFDIVPHWESDWDKFPPPGNFTIGPPPECLQALEVRIHDLREDFTLTLFANPFIKDRKDCPSAESEYFHLQKFHLSRNVTKGNFKDKSTLFGKIFTGCYYVEMENAEGRKWIWDGSFQERTYPYHITTLKCNNFQLKPEDQNVSSQFKYNITIPLTCSRLRCQVFDDGTKHTKDVVDSGKIPAIQDCSITYNGNGVKPLVECSSTDTHFQLSTDYAVDKGQGWEVNMRLSHLKNGTHVYSVKWEQHIDKCNVSVGNEHTCEDYDKRNPYHITLGDLMTWKSAINFGAFFHVVENVTNTPPPGPAPPGFWQSSTFIMILSILLGVIVTTPLVYYMSKYAKVFLRRKHISNNLFVNPSESEPDPEEFDHILLIYAYDSPEVMRAIKALSTRLQQTSQFPIHDLYSNDEAPLIMRLGATGWVENLLRDGGRVVWVDTPQFRSVMKDSKLNKGQQKQHKVGDFRDEAVPYAVKLATNLFQNATTQYRCHFVIRLEGLEVDDGNDDPLRVVSPHVRYSYPEHLDLLCEDLAR